MSIINGLYYGAEDTENLGTFTVDITTSGWVGTSSPYTYTVNIPAEFRDKSIFLYNLVPTSGTTVTETERIAFSRISKTTVENNKITFTCNASKPGIALKVAMCSTSSEMLYSIRNILGKTDISNVGDGTLTGAIKYIASRASDIIIKLPTTDWVQLQDGTYKFEYKQPDVLKTSNPMYGLIPLSSKPSSEELAAFGCLEKVEVTEGLVTVISKNPMPNEISIVVKGCALVNTADNSSFIIVNQGYQLKPSDWVLNSSTKQYEAEITNPIIRENHIVNVNFKSDSLETMYNAGVLEYNDSCNGKVVLYATSKPSATVVCDYMIYGTGSGVPGTYGVIGDTTALTTNNKESVIAAINEINDRISNHDLGGGSISFEEFSSLVGGDINSTNGNKSTLLVRNNDNVGKPTGYSSNEYTIGGSYIEATALNSKDDNGNDITITSFSDKTLATESAVMDALTRLIGNIASLTTEGKTLVDAINELNEKITKLNS